MAKVILGMTMSLDGYIHDRNGSVKRLFSDMVLGNIQDESIQNNELMQEAINNTGAVVMGKNAFLMADNPDSYADTYEFQVPIFVLTKNVPDKKPKENENLTFTFVTGGIKTSIDKAKAAAGNRDVIIIGGASTAQQALRAGLVDEIQIDLMPVILGKGLRLFENIHTDVIEMEKVVVVEMPVRTHLRFRVLNNQ